MLVADSVAPLNLALVAVLGMILAGVLCLYGWKNYRYLLGFGIFLFVAVQSMTLIRAQTDELGMVVMGGLTLAGLAVWLLVSFEWVTLLTLGALLAIEISLRAGMSDWRWMAGLAVASGIAAIVLRRHWVMASTALVGAWVVVALAIALAYNDFAILTTRCLLGADGQGWQYGVGIGLGLLTCLLQYGLEAEENDRAWYRRLDERLRASLRLKKPAVPAKEPKRQVEAAAPAEPSPAPPVPATPAD